MSAPGCRRSAVSPIVMPFLVESMCRRRDCPSATFSPSSPTPGEAAPSSPFKRRLGGPRVRNMTQFKAYLTEEVVEDYCDGITSRREALRRLGLLGVGAALAAPLLAACDAARQNDD